MVTGKWMALSLMVTAMGCGSEGAGTCPGEPPAGSYHLEADRRSGDCTGYLESVVVYGGGPAQPDPDCVDNSPPTSDACGELSDSTCLTRAGDGTLLGEERHIVSLDYDGDGAHGLLTVIYTDYESADYDCRATYDVTVSPL